MQFSQQAWCFRHIGPYGENSLQSDQTATNSSRRQNPILVTFLKVSARAEGFAPKFGEAAGAQVLDEVGWG